MSFFLFWTPLVSNWTWLEGHPSLADSHFSLLTWFKFSLFLSPFVHWMHFFNHGNKIKKPSPQRRRCQYFHVKTSKSSERRERIALLRENERCSSHLLFTCFLVLSLTSGCGVSVKRRRCDHSAINASVKTSGAARKRRLFRVAASPVGFCSCQRETTVCEKTSSRTDQNSIKTETSEERRSQNSMIAALLLHLVGKDAEKKEKNKRNCEAEEAVPRQADWWWALLRELIITKLQRLGAAGGPLGAESAAPSGDDRWHCQWWCW